MAHRHHKTPKREARIVCAAKKKKQQFGRSANAATPGILDEELEAAYRQFGKALGETPRETSQVVHENLNIPAASAQGRSGTSANPNERRMSEESYAQFEAMLDRAMKGSGDSQPKSLLKGKNTVALQAGERERRKVIMELMESTLYSETESFSVDLGLDVIQPASRKPQEEVPELILPRGKAATSAKRPAARAAAGKLEGTPALAGPLPVPALQMPKGKLPRREPPATATVAPPAALQPPLPVPAFAPKPSLAAPKVDWKVTEIDEGYVNTRQEAPKLSQKTPAAEKAPPAQKPEPIPAILRPAKPSRPATDDTSGFTPSNQAASSNEAAASSAASKPAVAPTSERPVAPPPKLAAPPVQQSTSPSAADKTVSDALPAASATAPPVTARARTPEKEVSRDRPAQPPRQAAPPVPALQRPTAAPEAAEASIPAAASVTNPAPADSGLIGNALESLQQAGPEKPEADVPRPAPAAAAAASIESADASSSLKAAGAPEIAPMAAAPAREDSAEKRAEPALAPPLQRPAGKPVRRRPPPREAGSKNGAPATPGAYDLAVAALATERPLPGKVVKTSAGGVVVRVQAGFQGFLPWSKMLPHRNLVVLERERAAQAALDPPEDPSAQQEARLQLRRDAMAGLQDNRVMVYVHEVKRQEEEVYFKTMLSEKGPQSKPLLDYPPYQTEVLQEMLGERVDARVRKVTEYGAFLTFPVEVYAGYSLEMFGLLHRSKMGDLSLESLQEGQQVTAYLLTLDVVKGHVEMSAEPPTLPMPINQTLEDLILSSGAAKQGKEGSPDEEVESMPEAMDVCRELLLSGAITEATPGRRLQGRAFSPEVQVFMARNEGEAVATGESGPKRYTLLARARNEVQEIEVESGLERDEMKTALGLALSTVLAVM